MDRVPCLPSKSFSPHCLESTPSRLVNCCPDVTSKGDLFHRTRNTQCAKPLPLLPKWWPMLPPNFLSSRSVPLQPDPKNIKLLFYYFYDFFFKFYSRYITCKNCTIFSLGSLWVIFIHRWQCILNVSYYVRACFSRSYQLSHDLYKKKYLA